MSLPKLIYASDQLSELGR